MGALPGGVTGTDREDASRAIVYGLDIQSCNTGIAAAAAGTQAVATILRAGINVVESGGANASVALPATNPQTDFGLCVCVINISGAAISVFGQGNDAINGLAAAASVSMMNNSIAYFTLTKVSALGVGAWIATGIGTGFAASGNGSFPTYSSQDNVVPTVGGNQASAVLITQSTAGCLPGVAGTDAVRLPPAKSGMEVTIINKSAGNAMIVFPASAAQGGIVGGDAINNQAVNTSLPVAAATVLLFYCLTDGTWWSK